MQGPYPGSKWSGQGSEVKNLFAPAQTAGEELQMQSQTLARTGFSEAINGPEEDGEVLPFQRKPPHRVSERDLASFDQLLTADEVAARLRVSKDWVWDHSSRKTPRLPVIRMGDGALRYRSSAIEAFISERERLSFHRSKRR
jgi:predicted DNA-binding transcriptional regulator AlpA